MSSSSGSSYSSRLVAVLLLVLSAIVFVYVTYFRPGGGDAGVESRPDGGEQGGAVPAEPESQGAADDVQWESEQFSEVVTSQLNQLMKLIASDDDLSDVDFSELVAADVGSTELRPRQLIERFQTDSLTVRHADSLSGDRKTGLTAFRERAAALSQPLSKADHRHDKVKVISVDRHSDSKVSTDVIIQRAGETADGSFQQDALWRCEWSSQGLEDDSPRLRQITVLEYEESEVSSPERHLFSDCTESVFRNESSFREQLMPGIDYWRSRTQKQHGVFPFGHHGIAIGDVNNDGLEDLYAGQPSGLPNRLYIQNEDGTVTDRAADGGVDILNRTRGVLLVDLDNDSDLDLVAVLKELIVFMANDGAGHFEEMSAVPTTEPGGLSACDFDLDGDLDIYVVNYGDRFRSSPDVYHDANNGGANVLLRNDGQWRFTDVTTDVGLDANNTRWSFAASWEDFDDDGDSDLYVANDFGRNNLYRNDGGTFTDVAPDLDVEDIAAGMSVSWADFDHDGRMDVYIGNMFSSAGLRVTGQQRFLADASASVRDDFKRHARGNTLYRSLPNGGFEDVSVDAGVTIGRWAWASPFVDINNDSWEDIVVANGFVTGHQTKDL